MKRVVMILFILGMARVALAQNTFPSSGNVGIGTNTPSYNLEVVGAIMGNALIGETIWAGNGSEGNIRKLNSDIPLRFITSTGAEEMRIHSNGYVGIGTSSPVYPLQVIGNIQGTGIIGQTLWVGGDGVQGSIRKLDTGIPLRFITSTGSEEMRIAANGYVGIGTSSPAYPLQVNGNIQGTGIIGQTLWVGGDGVQGNIRKHDTDIPLRFVTSTGSEEMRIAANGNVGIGTAIPDEKLTVAGKIHSREVKVTATAGADFVFDEDYKLRSLPETENFIKNNKHLPEIASAEDMKTNGIQLGEMNIKLLQKIEELTLYLIEQSKDINELKDSNVQLKAEINQLKSKP